MNRAMQLRTLIYALVLAGVTSAYMLFLDQADHLTWVNPALLMISLAFVAIGIFSSIKGRASGRRDPTDGKVNSPRRVMVSAVVLTLCGLSSICFSGTLLVRTAEVSTGIGLIGGLFAFASGLVQLIQERQKRG